MEITVKACTKVKEWNGKPIYSVEFSDGSKGNSFGSEIPVGTSKAELTITPKEGYPDDIKMKKANGFGGRSQPAKGNESFALNYAKDWAVAKLDHDPGIKTDDILKIADVFFNWLESKKK